MSELEGKTSEDLSRAVRLTFGIVLNANQRIKEARLERDARLDALRGRIREEGIPEKDRFVVRTLLDPDMARKAPEAIAETVEFWEKFDKEVSSHAGETIAWLEPEEVTVSHRFPGPNSTKFEYYLNLGILPADAQLQDEGSVGFKLPVEKAVRVRFLYNLDEELAWDMGIGDTFNFVGEPELVDHPEILPAEGRILPCRAWGFPFAVPIPLPVIGNEAVAAILEANNLADQPEVIQSAQMLTESLAA